MCNMSRSARRSMDMLFTVLLTLSTFAHGLPKDARQHVLLPTSDSTNTISPLRGTRRLHQSTAFRNCVANITGIGRILYKGSGSEYDTSRSRISNPRFLTTKFPAAIVFPRTARQAAMLVACAVQHSLKVAVRSGGHNYEGLCLVNDGLVIDTGLLTNISFTSRNGQEVVVLGAGQRIGPTLSALWNQRKGMSTGVCDSVGLAGVTLGGGIGPNLRKQGLTSDALVEAEVVTADGRVVTASSSSNSDLFWAIRGGGGNYGLLTSLTYRLFTPPPLVSVLQVAWPNSWTNMRDLMTAYFNWKPYSLSDNYSYVELYMGKNACRLLIYYWGPRSDLQTLYDTHPMFKAGSGKWLERLQEMTYDKYLEYYMNPWSSQPLSGMTLDSVIRRAFDSNAGRGQYKASSAFLSRQPNSTSIHSLANAVNGYKDKAWIQIHAMGGAVNRVAVNATAFPHRNTQYQLQIYIHEYSRAFIQQVQTAIQPFSTGLQYLNYIDTDTPNPWATYFGPNGARLTQAKTKWDPNKVFDAVNQR